MTVVIESDHVMYLSALIVRSEWFFPVGAYLSLFWQMIHCSLHIKDQQERRAVVGKPHVAYDAVVKFDTYRNLQRHRAVLPAIARLSCC